MVVYCRFDHYIDVTGAYYRFDHLSVVCRVGASEVERSGRFESAVGRVARSDQYAVHEQLRVYIGPDPFDRVPLAVVDRKLSYDRGRHGIATQLVVDLRQS